MRGFLSLSVLCDSSIEREQRGRGRCEASDRRLTHELLGLPSVLIVSLGFGLSAIDGGSEETHGWNSVVASSIRLLYQARENIEEEEKRNIKLSIN